MSLFTTTKKSPVGPVEYAPYHFLCDSSFVEAGKKDGDPYPVVVIRNKMNGAPQPRNFRDTGWENVHSSAEFLNQLPAKVTGAFLNFPGLTVEEMTKVLDNMLNPKKDMPSIDDCYRLAAAERARFAEQQASVEAENEDLKARIAELEAASARQATGTTGTTSTGKSGK